MEEDIMKIFKSIKEPALLIKGVKETIGNESKEQNDGFLSMLLGTLDTSLLRNLLVGKAFKSKLPGWGVTRAGERTNRADQYF